MHQKTTRILSIILGIILLVMGTNKLPGIGGFLPMPGMPPEAQKVLGGLSQGYVLPWLVMVTELTTGVLLVFGQWVPLALVLLAPLSVNVLVFHFTTSIPQGFIAYTVAGLNLALLLMFYPRYKPMLKRK